jgi:hypothetical protein
VDHQLTSTTELGERAGANKPFWRDHGHRTQVSHRGLDVGPEEVVELVEASDRWRVAEALWGPRVLYQSSQPFSAGLRSALER